MTYKLYMSPSMLGRVATCETQAMLATLGYGGLASSVPAAAGTVMHAGLAHILQQQPYDTALEAWRETELYKRLDDADALDNEFRAENLAEILREWERRYIKHLPVEVQGVEKAFDLTIGRFKISSFQPEIEFHLIGVMDFYGFDEADRIRIGETKTTRKQMGEGFEKRYLLDIQNSAYIYAATKLFPDRPVIGSTINLIKMMKCPDSTKRCPKHWLEAENRATLYLECGPKHLVMEMFNIDRTPGQLQDFSFQMLRWAEQYAEICVRTKDLNNMYLANMNGLGVREACIYCDGFEYCLASRPADAVERELLRRMPPNPDKLVSSGLVVKA
jgi:PD-(D/E)XK nuclease superfamily